MITIRRADKEDLRNLSRKLLTLLKDEESQVFREEAAKFGVPRSYIMKVFSEAALLEAADKRNATFHIALEGGEIIGFAETIKLDDHTAELDRLIVFPPWRGRGVGTSLLHKALADMKKQGVKMVTVNVGRDEVRARRFYEKNGFEGTEERTVEAPWGREIALVIYRRRL